MKKKRDYKEAMKDQIPPQPIRTTKPQRETQQCWRAGGEGRFARGTTRKETAAKWAKIGGGKQAAKALGIKGGKRGGGITKENLATLRNRKIEKTCRKKSLSNRR